MSTTINSRPLVSSLVRRDLHDGWHLTASAGPADIDVQNVPATVPGVVHLDLMAAGLIPDPYLDDNESRLAWIGLVDWTYRTSFDVSDSELVLGRRHDLVFDGLDTVADIRLNGEPLLSVANQHRTYRIDVTDRLRADTNELVVAFHSPIRHANAMSVKLGARPRPYPMPFEAIRKSACNFGWDWGIATFTSGIWRPVRLESWSTARLDSVSVTATPGETGGTVTAEITIARAPDAPALAVDVVVETAGTIATATIAADAASTHVEIHLEQIELWWPLGYGEQPLTEVDLHIRAGETLLDETTRRVGFRTVRWDTTPDADGTPFQLVVNQQPVFVKGVNWIPDDAFPTRVTRERYAARLRQAADANLNLIRVWGGGIYESDDFFEVCDELGLLTWQDFLFACAAYPEEEPLRSEIEAEARDNIQRIAHHASLVLLTGNNENLWGYEDWGWKARLDGRTWGAYYYHELFPELIGDLAAHVPYAPGSPFSPGGEHPNDERHGTMHIWDLWNQRDWPHYRDYTPRFVAEFGWQGPASWTTLTRAISDSPLTPESPGMIVHQKAIDGNAKLAAGLVAHYRVPDDIEEWHWAMQLNQANAVACALDWFRSHSPQTSGAVVWQLNDCWPVTSWSAIDGDGRAKPLLHAIRNSFAPRTVTIQPRAEGLTVTVTNDTRAHWAGELRLALRAYDGVVHERYVDEVDVSPYAAVTITVPDLLTAPIDARETVLTAELDDVRGTWFFVEPRDSALTSPNLRVQIEPVATNDDEVAVSVTTDVLVRDLTLLADRLHPDATVGTGLITLLPGETTVFRVSGIGAATVDDVSRPEVLRSGNQLVVS